MCLCVRCCCDVVWRVTSTILCYNHPPESIIVVVHVLNFIIRLGLVAMAITIQMMFPYSAEPMSASFSINAYKFSDWEAVSIEKVLDGTQSNMYVILSTGRISTVLMWTMIVVSLLFNDICRCIEIIRGKWIFGDNHLDVTWYTISSFSAPLLFGFTALSLGTHDMVIVILVVWLVFISSVAAGGREVTHTQVRPDFAVAFSFQMIHDLALSLAAGVIMSPFMLNLLYFREEITAWHYTNAILFVSMYTTMMLTNHLYEYRCSVIETRWPSQPSVILRGMPRQSALEKVCNNVETCFPYFPDAGKPDADIPGFNNGQLNPEGSDHDPFNIKNSELVFDHIYYGCHHYETSVHLSNEEIQSTKDYQCGHGSFHTHMENIERITREGVGRLCEWRRYFAINLCINALLVVGILNMIGLIEPGYHQMSPSHS
jgi:hypothetical protein